MKQIIIDYDEYLRLERHEKRLEKIKSYIQTHTIQDVQLGALVTKVIMNDNLNRELVDLAGTVER